jgi:hypothetical protein
VLIIRDGPILKLRWPAEFVSAEVESRDLAGETWELMPVTPVLLNAVWEALKWTPKLRPPPKLDFPRSAQCEKEQIDEKKTQTV